MSELSGFSNFRTSFRTRTKTLDLWPASVRPLIAHLFRSCVIKLFMIRTPTLAAMTSLAIESEGSGQHSLR